MTSMPRALRMLAVVKAKVRAPNSHAVIVREGMALDLKKIDHE